MWYSSSNIFNQNMKNLNFNFRIPLWQYFFLLGSIFLFYNCTTEPQNDPNQEEWHQLFNGKDMEDWIPKVVGHNAGVNYKQTFRVSDSLLQVRYFQYDSFRTEFGHLFYKEKFSHYRLRATYRFIDEQLPGGPGWAFRNNGLMLHCQSPESMGIDQDFPISLEAQLLGGNGTDERPTNNLCTPGTNVVMGDTLFTPHCISSSSKTYHGDQWVAVEVLVLGDSLIQHIVEDNVVLEYSHPTVGGGSVDGNTLHLEEGSPIAEGYISIQSETHPIDFKKIELLNLCGCKDERAKNYKAYYVKADNSKCHY